MLDLRGLTPISTCLYLSQRARLPVVRVLVGDAGSVAESYFPQSKAKQSGRRDMI